MNLATHLKRLMMGAAFVAGLTLLLMLADPSTAQDRGGKKGKKGKKGRADVVEVDLSKLPPELARAVRRYAQGEDEHEGEDERRAEKGKRKKGKGFEDDDDDEHEGKEGKKKKGFGKSGKGFEGKKKGPRVITIQPGERIIIEVAGDGRADERREGKGREDFGKKKGKGKKKKGGDDDD